MIDKFFILSIISKYLEILICSHMSPKFLYNNVLFWLYVLLDGMITLHIASFTLMLVNTVAPIKHICC